MTEADVWVGLAVVGWALIATVVMVVALFRENRKFDR